MKRTEESGAYLFVPNQRTGRIEVYEAIGNNEKLVGSMPGESSDSDIRGMCHRLEAEKKTCK